MALYTVVRLALQKQPFSLWVHDTIGRRGARDLVVFFRYSNTHERHGELLVSISRQADWHAVRT